MPRGDIVDSGGAGRAGGFSARPKRLLAGQFHEFLAREERMQLVTGFLQFFAAAFLAIQNGADGHNVQTGITHAIAGFEQRAARGDIPPSL